MMDEVSVVQYGSGFLVDDVARQQGNIVLEYVGGKFGLEEDRILWSISGCDYGSGVEAL